jgi:bifunctional non-homologous end joining protein LigD
MSEVVGVHLSHPEKVLFPQQGITKRGLVDYYLAVQERILPELRTRPVSLKRCPAGEDGTCFFQKHAGSGLSTAIDTVSIREKDEDQADYLVLNGIEALIAAVQMGTLELHIWGARADDIERPDRLVMDLDPDADVDFDRVKNAAIELRAILEGLGLRSFALLTGGKGVHVVAPLVRRHEWPVIKEFSRQLAETLAATAPGRFTTNMRKSARDGRIFIDYLRNERGSTAICPWSTRAHPRAPIAMPVSWDELARTRRPDAFTIETAIERIGEDPWPGHTRLRQSLTRAAAAKLDARA